MSQLPFRFIDDGEPGTASLAAVFLHAFPYHAGMWEPQRAALPARARFVALDARGMGPDARLAAPPTAFMLEHLVDDLFTLLDARGIERAVLCGLSLGGYVALRAVQREPQRVAGLLLADTQAGADSDEAKLGRAQGLRLLAREGQAAFVRAQLERQLCEHTRSARPELVHRAEQLMLDSAPLATASCLVALATRTDLRGLLPELRVPTAVVVGAEDAITPPSVARSLQEQIPGATLHVLERAGHLSNLEAERDFNQALLGLIARVS